MARFKFLFSRSNLLFLLAMHYRYIFTAGSRNRHPLILPALMVILTITLLRFPRGFFRRPGPLLSACHLGQCHELSCFGKFHYFGEHFSDPRRRLWIGMVLIAAVPPAVT